MRKLLAVALSIGTVVALGDDEKNRNSGASCAGLPTDAQLRSLLIRASNASGVSTYGQVGGIFGGTRMWASVVNREGEVCSSNTSMTDKSQVWPGSEAISKSKAYTANAFSLDSFTLSTAQLYTFTQPGHSLWSLGQSNVFGSRPLTAQDKEDGHGLIFFGGGVPIYRAGKIIGGLGVSGDTSCADHEIAKRVRDLASLNPPGGMLVDDITYTSSVFAHPVCLTTYKNGAFIGNEAPAVYPSAP